MSDLGFPSVASDCTSKPDQSIANNELALKINPTDPLNSHRYFGLTLAHYLASRYAQAVENTSRVIEVRPWWWLGLIVHAASLAQCGRAREAQMACAELRRGKRDMSLISLDGLPFAKERDRAHVADGLRKAGLSDL